MFIQVISFKKKCTMYDKTTSTFKLIILHIPGMILGEIFLNKLLSMWLKLTYKQNLNIFGNRNKTGLNVKE